jgi:hypothetical protein
MAREDSYSDGRHMGWQLKDMLYWYAVHCLSVLSVILLKGSTLKCAVCDLVSYDDNKNWCRLQMPALRTHIKTYLFKPVGLCELFAFRFGHIHILWRKLYVPLVEAGKNTSTVIPASRKGRRKGNRISLRWDSASRPKRRLMGDLFLDKPLHVIQNHSKLAYII